MDPKRSLEPAPDDFAFGQVIVGEEHRFINRVVRRDQQRKATGVRIVLYPIRQKPSGGQGMTIAGPWAQVCEVRHCRPPICMGLMSEFGAAVFH
jgi:hypothetical protein